MSSALLCGESGPSTSMTPGLTSCDSGYDSASKTGECGASGGTGFGAQRAWVLPAHDAALSSPAVHANLRAAESFPRRLPSDYWMMQKDLEPFMRGQVVAWVRDVCAEERLEVEVFPLAVSVLDRFLSVQQIFRGSLQAAAAAAIFLASKVKQTLPVSALKLVALTDDSVPLNELMSWELLLLSKLEWDVSAATAVDFVQLLLPRLGLPPALADRLRALAFHLLSTLLQDASLWRLRCEAQAAVVLLAASVSVVPEADFFAKLLSALAHLTHIPPEELLAWTETVESRAAAEAEESGASSEDAASDPRLPPTPPAETRLGHHSPLHQPSTPLDQGSAPLDQSSAPLDQGAPLESRRASPKRQHSAMQTSPPQDEPPAKLHCAAHSPDHFQGPPLFMSH